MFRNQTLAPLQKKPHIAGGMEYFITAGFIILFLLSMSGIVGSVLQFIGYSCVIIGIHTVKKVNKWFHRAYFLSVASLCLMVLATILSAVEMPNWVQNIYVLQSFALNVTVLLTFFFLHFGVRDETVEQGMEPNKKILIGAILILVYYVLSYLYQIFNNSLFYVIILVGGMLIFVFVILMLYLGLKEFATLPRKFELCNKNRSIIVCLAAFVVVAAVTAALNYKATRIEPSKSQELASVQTDESSAIRLKLNQLGLPKEATDMLNDTEAAKYQNAVSVKKIDRYELDNSYLKENDKGEITGETETYQNSSQNNDSQSSDDKNTEKTPEKSSEDSSSLTKNIETADMYRVSLANHSYRILICFEPGNKGKDIDRYRDGIFVNVKSTGKMNLSDVSGQEICTGGQEPEEEEFSVFQNNLTDEEQIGSHVFTYSYGMYDMESVKVSDKNANFLAVNSSRSGKEKNKKGYVAFTLKEVNTKTQKYYVSLKYVAQTQKLNYPYTKLEDVLLFYVDGYSTTTYCTMDKITWQIRSEVK